MNQPKEINPVIDRKINSEQKLINYVRTMLGEPLITVDVTDDQIKMIIDEAFRKYSDYVYEGMDRMIFVIEGSSNVQDYRLDERVQAVKSVSFGGALGSIPTSSSGNYV
jgi:hypothetical protein